MAKSLKFWKITGASLLSIGALSICGAAIMRSSSAEPEETKAAADYSACETAHNSGNASSLLTALRAVTATGTSGSYSALWTTYTSAFVKSDGYIKDYYSSASKFTVSNQDNGSGGTTEGDKYNREHSIPKSWWGQSGNPATGTQGTDPFFVIPADKLVNNKRSSNPLGEVQTATFTSSGGYSKLGAAKSSWGYSGTVFEPNDEVKGDLARMVFYVIAKYNNSYSWTSGEGSSTFSGSASTNFGLTTYAVKLFSYWSNLDPVDNWERSLNTALYGIQGNTNPFIDHPEYANTLWGSVSGYTTYTGSGGSTPSTDPSASISPSSVSVQAGSSSNVSASLTNVTNASNITWSSGDTSIATVTKGTTSTSSSAATITGVAQGSTTVYCKHSGTTIGSVNVTVTTSGGSSGGNAGDATLYSGTISEGDYVIVYDNKAMKNTVSSNRLTYSEVTISNDTISSPDSSIVWHIAPSGSYWTIYNSSVSKYAAANGTKNQAQLLDSGSDDKSLWTVTGSSTYEFVNKNNSANSVNANLRENTTYGFACYATGTGGALSLYKVSSGSSTKTLSSISVKTAPTKTTYTAGEYFSPTGLVINRNYSDSTSDTYTYADHTSEFTFSPSTSTALTTSNTSVTITYGGKSCDQAITVNAPAVTSISASVSKTYYVGETITSSDITVTDSNNENVSSFTFSSNNYQFTYADANSGGALTSKTFTNAITGSGKTCSLTVQVQRKAYVAPTSSVTDTIAASDLAATDTGYVDFSNVAKTSSARYAGNSAKNGNNIQLNSSSPKGIVSTTSGGTISSVKITVGSSNTKTINVYGKNTAYSSAADLYNTSSQGTLVGSTSSTGTITFTTGYAYVGIRSSSGAVYISSIEITYGSSETPVNVANYIMYQDNNGQCTTRYSVAKGYFNNLSSGDKSTFMTSTDYVISTARTRLQAWAAYHGESISSSNGTYVIGSNKSINSLNGNNYSLVIALATFGTVSVLLGLSFIGYSLKKKEQ